MVLLKLLAQNDVVCADTRNTHSASSSRSSRLVIHFEMKAAPPPPVPYRAWCSVLQTERRVRLGCLRLEALTCWWGKQAISKGIKPPVSRILFPWVCWKDANRRMSAWWNGVRDGAPAGGHESEKTDHRRKVSGNMGGRIQAACPNDDGRRKQGTHLPCLIALSERVSSIMYTCKVLLLIQETNKQRKARFRYLLPRAPPL